MRVLVLTTKGLGVRIVSTPVPALFPARADLVLHLSVPTTLGRKPQLRRLQVFPSCPALSSAPCLTPAPQPDRPCSAGQLLCSYSRQTALPAVASFISWDSFVVPLHWPPLETVSWVRWTSGLSRSGTRHIPLFLRLFHVKQKIREEEAALQQY